MEKTLEQKTQKTNWLKKNWKKISLGVLTLAIPMVYYLAREHYKKEMEETKRIELKKNYFELYDHQKPCAGG